MTHLISIIRSFLAEIFFKNKDEATFGHPKFNLFKWLKFAAVMASFVLNLFALPKLVNLGIEHTTLLTKCEQLENKLEAKLIEEQYKNFTPW